jgi:hypothetical protein
VADPLTVEDFRPRVGEAFVVRADDGAGIELELTEARSLGEAFQDREAFSLLFRGPAEPVMPQATYRMANDGLGEQDIFIVPVGRTDVGTDYEAIFT